MSTQAQTLRSFDCLTVQRLEHKAANCTRRLSAPGEVYHVKCSGGIHTKVTCHFHQEFIVTLNRSAVIHLLYKYWGANKSLARTTSRYVLFDG